MTKTYWVEQHFTDLNYSEMNFAREKQAGAQVLLYPLVNEDLAIENGH